MRGASSALASVVALLGLLALAGCAGEEPEPAPELTNGIGMELVLVRPGRMTVGRFAPECPDSSAAARDDVHPRARWTAEDHARCREMAARDARPGFEVAIERAYYIGRHEVTQEQWTRVMGDNPSVFPGARAAGDASRHPVENVTWEDAQRFVARLNELERGPRYRLPTELEWEYAARAGRDDEPRWSEIRESGWISDVDKGTTHPVGGKAPNAWGLHDTLGNVWEWVEDFYNEEMFPDSVPPRSGATHVLRGGSFTSDVKNATWFTHAGGPGNGFDVGFRVVREVR
ncbi:MAG TPA: formylglycine-generating enzyme family protein [Gemmatimonadaceae bacterium]